MKDRVGIICLVFRHEETQTSARGGSMICHDNAAIFKRDELSREEKSPQITLLEKEKEY